MKKKWFKAKKYGWGWTPATKAGWLLTVGFAAYVGLATSLYGYVLERIDTLDTEVSLALTVLYILSVLFALAMFSLVAFLTGDKLAIRWGDDDLR